ncbi:hypothetical protein NXY56_005471 [Leishmania guyanensis]
MRSNYMYDESADLSSPLRSLVGSVTGNLWATRSTTSPMSNDDFQTLTGNSSLLSYSQYDIPLFHSIEVPPGKAQVHPDPLSPPASPQALVDRTKPRTSLRTNRQRYSSSWQRGSIELMRSDCTPETSKLSGPPLREPGADTHGDLFGSKGPFMYVDDYCASSSSVSGSSKLPFLSGTNSPGQSRGLGRSSIDTTTSGNLKNLARRLSRSGAIQDSVDASKRTPLPGAPASFLPTADTPSATATGSDRRCSQDNSSGTGSTTAPPAAQQREPTSAAHPAQFASSGATSRVIKVSPTTLTLPQPSAEFTLLLDYPIIKDRGSAARSSGHQLSPQALASQSSLNPSRGARGMAGNADSRTLTPLGVEDIPDKQARHRSTLGGVLSSVEHSSFSPSPGWRSSSSVLSSSSPVPCARTASDLRIRSEHHNLNRSGSGAGGMSPVRQQRAASEPSPTALERGNHVSLCRTVQPPVQSVSSTPTSACVPGVGTTESSGYGNRDEEEADSSSLACQPGYDLSCVPGAVEDTAEAKIDPLHYNTDALDGDKDGYSSLVNLQDEEEEPSVIRSTEKPPSEVSSRSTTNQHPKNETAPALTPPHAPPMPKKRFFTLEPVRTNTSAMAKGGNSKLRFDGSGVANRSDEELSSESSMFCAMRPLHLADPNASLSQSLPLTARVPGLLLHDTRSEHALGAVVTNGAQCLSMPLQSTNAVALNGKAPPTGTTESRRARLPSTVLSNTTQDGAQALTTLSGNTNSSEPNSREASEAAASSSISPPPILSTISWAQPMCATTLSDELQNPLRPLHCRVCIHTDTNGIDDAPTTRVPWPLQNPPSSIIVKRRLFDPKLPRPRGPRTRGLLNGMRQADWTPPETHYATTLADMAAFEEDEDGIQQCHLTGTLWDDEVIGMDAPVSRLPEMRGGQLSSCSTPVLRRGILGVMLRTRSPVSPPRVPLVPSLVPMTLSTSPETPAVLEENVTIQGSPKLVSCAPPTAAASGDAPTSVMWGSFSTSVNAGRRTGGIVVDEVEKVHRLREESAITPVLEALRIEPSSLLSQSAAVRLASQVAPSHRCLGASIHPRHSVDSKKGVMEP